MKKDEINRNPALDEETLSTKPIFAGHIISLQVDTVRLPDGNTATREVVKHPGAVAVLALNQGKMLVVEQYRQPMHRTEVEIPAGKLDQEKIRWRLRAVSFRRRPDFIAEG